MQRPRIISLAFSISGLGLLACTTSGPAQPKHQGPRPAASPTPNRGPEMSYEQLLMAAQSYMEAGSPQRAGETARRANEQDPKRPEAYQILGRALAMQNDLKASSQAYAKAWKLGARNRQLVVELGSVYDVSGAYSKAAALYTRWLDEHPDDTELRHQLGLTLLLSGDGKSAVTELQRAQKQAPNNIQIAQDLGYAFLSVGEYESAERICAQVFAADPNRLDAGVFLAKALAAQGKLEAAATVLDRLVAKEKDSGQSQAMRARVRLILGNSEGAWQDFQQLLKAAPNNPDLLLGGAASLLGLSQLDQAETLIARAEKEVGEHPLVQFRKAELALYRGDRSALSRMHTLAKSQPQNAAAWRALLEAAEHTKSSRVSSAARQHLNELGIPTP